MVSEPFAWEITPSEKRSRIKNFIIYAVPAFFCLTLFLLLEDQATISSWAREGGLKSVTANFLAIFGVMAGIIGIFFIANQFWPYSRRTYRISPAGIEITKDNKQKFYPWTNFIRFYPYRSIGVASSRRKNKQSLTKIIKVNQETEGQIFYLQKKNHKWFSFFYKTFVVVYSEPDNSGKVSSYLEQHLPKNKMTDFTDLGLIFYYFK